MSVPPGGPHVTGIVFRWPPISLSFPTPHAQAGLLSMLETDPKAARKQRTALVYFCKVLTRSLRNETLLKGF